MRKKIIVGISGASGVQYGIEILKILKAIDVESHLILSSPAEITVVAETHYTVSHVKALASYTHNIKDVGALCASGTFRNDGMIIAPCSMKSLGEIANGICGNLLTRSADVTLKERKKLVVMPRETPLNLSHIRNMETITLMGGIIAPPMPAYYTRPESIEQMIYQTSARALELLDLSPPNIERWKQDKD